jgi:SAM-dependent methyltransferase
MKPDPMLGCKMEPADWARINRVEVFEDPSLERYVAAFPPQRLMQNVSGLTNRNDFASHGADFWLAFSEAAPRALADYSPVLDFGCGCGRLARMFLGHGGEIHGCDIDARHVQWVDEHLPYVQATLTQPDRPLPYPDAKFGLIVSISVFTHLNEASQDLLLAELHRIARRDGTLMLTIHGERAIERALTEKAIWDMLSVDRALFEAAHRRFQAGQHAFILQQGHLTNGDFEYGITFLPHAYIQSHWGRRFRVDKHVVGALHDFQDIVVLTPR